jgi:GT2 family glycosyltransferase
VIDSAAAYNFSALNNLAARHAKGSFLLLLNNDTEVISPEWLTEMMRYAYREDVGAVGAKLLYDDGSIQHAGVVVGMGEAAGHAHRFLAHDDPGYFWQAHVAQYASAVTAACLLVRLDKFEAVDGLDEKELAIAYNDVDLCLKLERAGWHNVYTPHATLYHHESRSRGDDLSPQHRERYMRELKIFQDRWGARTYADPLHNPNLDRYVEQFTVNLRQ